MIIGVTGWFASGKDTVCDYLAEKGFEKISLSDIIREYCKKENLELSRDNLRNMGNKLREQFGPDFLAKEALKRIKENSNNKNFVIPSVRQTAEVEVFRQESDFQLWEVYAPSKIRYERLIKRARSEDEKNISYDKFIQKENSEKGGGPNCQQVDKVIEMSDQRIDNSGTLEELYQKIDRLI